VWHFTLTIDNTYTYVLVITFSCKCFKYILVIWELIKCFLNKYKRRTVYLYQYIDLYCQFWICCLHSNTTDQNLYTRLIHYIMSFGIYQSGSAELDFINCQRVNHGYFILNWQHKPEAHPSSYHFIIDHISLFLKRRLSFLFPFSFIFICHYDHILGFHFNIHVQWGLNQVNRFWVKLLSFIPSPQKLYIQLCPVTSVI
jgi:hypothetical protein